MVNLFRLLFTISVTALVNGLGVFSSLSSWFVQLRGASPGYTGYRLGGQVIFDRYDRVEDLLPSLGRSSSSLSSFPSSFKSSYASESEHLNTNANVKSIAIIGGGSAGLSALKTFLDVAESTGQQWTIELFEQRRGVGGVWLPDPHSPQPPDLPETPLYPQLRTNTPHPSMTYPGFPFPPNTNLYPHHEALRQYHVDFASYYNLTSHIHVNHAVSSVSWIGNSTVGYWNLTIVVGYNNNSDKYEFEHERDYKYLYFDHLIDASGHNHFPHVPDWPGQDVWMGNSAPGAPKRELLHSIFWRGPEGYENKTVLVIGTGASGRDAVKYTAAVAKKTYLSMREDYDDPTGLPPHEIRTPVSHFTPTSIFFEDGSSCSDVDSIILGTGYEMRFPHLERGKTLHTIPSANSNATYPIGLVTNLRYVFPLHRHILSLAPQYPPTALIFIGLLSAIANFPSDKAQSLFAAYALADPHILPSREEMLHELNIREETLRLGGRDPYYVGHRLINDTSTPRGNFGQDYQDALVEYLKESGALPDDGVRYVEGWRRRVTSNSERLWDSWMRIEEMGEEREWLDGVETEEEWADLMDRLVE